MTGYRAPGEGGAPPPAAGAAQRPRCDKLENLVEIFSALRPDLSVLTVAWGCEVDSFVLVPARPTLNSVPEQRTDPALPDRPTHPDPLKLKLTSLGLSDRPTHMELLQGLCRWSEPTDRPTHTAYSRSEIRSGVRSSVRVQN